MQTNKVAAIYAQSLLELGTEEKILESLKQELEDIKELFSGNPDLELIYQAPVFNKSVKQELIDKIFGSFVSKTPLGFLKVLIRKNRETFFADIVNHFSALVDKSQNRLHVQVTTAKPLDPSSIASIEGSVAAKSGKKPIISNVIDESILGGLVIQINDTVADFSITKELELLREKIISSKLRSEEIYEN